jgi:hypothetical protein
VGPGLSKSRGIAARSNTPDRSAASVRTCTGCGFRPDRTAQLLVSLLIEVQGCADPQISNLDHESASVELASAISSSNADPPTPTRVDGSTDPGHPETTDEVLPGHSKVIRHRGWNQNKERPGETVFGPFLAGRTHPARLIDRWPATARIWRSSAN